MRFSNKVYDVLKYLILIAAPASITLISGLGVLFNFDATIINGVIGLVAAFIGSLIGVSTKNYNKEQERKENFDNL